MSSLATLRLRPDRPLRHLNPLRLDLYLFRCEIPFLLLIACVLLLYTTKLVVLVFRRSPVIDSARLRDHTRTAPIFGLRVAVPIETTGVHDLDTAW